MIKIKKIHSCYNCKKTFMDAIYWFDSLHFNNFDKRLIRPFCGPKCVQDWVDTNGARDWPNREMPYPKGDEWKIIDNIDFIDYITD